MVISPRADGLTVARSRGSAVAGAVAREARKAKSAAKINNYRRENPDEFRTWTTKYGCVVQFWGMRVYYGTCRDCPNLITARRAISQYKEGFTQIGRWPVLCGECKERRSAERAEATRKRMAELRRKRYASRDEQYRKIGLPVPRQGVPGYEAMLKREEDYLYGGYEGDPEWDHL